MLTIEELHQLGQSRYGKHWQTPMAREISELTGANFASVYKNINHWATGKMGLSTFAEAAVRLLCTNKNEHKLDVLLQLRELIDIEIQKLAKTTSDNITQS